MLGESTIRNTYRLDDLLFHHFRDINIGVRRHSLKKGITISCDNPSM